MKVYLERADEGGGKIEILRQGIAGFLVACGTQEGFSVAEQIEVIEDVLAELRTLPSEPQGSPPEPSRGDCVILQFPKAR